MVGPEAAMRTSFGVWGKERLALVKVLELRKVSYYVDENQANAMAYIFH